MAACTSFQSQMLDYLYDLLDADEGRALEEHLKVCPPCQAALKEAQGHRRLLSVAAKSDFPAVRFTVPSADAPAPEDRPPAVLLRRPRWAGWAVAATLLLAVGGLGVPGGAWAWKLHELRQQADVAKADYEESRKLAANFDRDQRNRQLALQYEMETARKDHEKAASDFQERQNKLNRAVAEQRLRVSLSGPPTLQPGAPNIYQVVIQEYNNQPADAQLTALVRDKNRKEVFKEEKVQVRGTHTLRLPAGVELHGEGPLALEISARRPNGPPSELRAELPLAAPLFITHL
ncbi:MAG: zf-HC2 domain-containing protein, partial [Acidobacteria bacterium]|nr:zf-HC2 domain-containing protein [Acidobacteriota bacterium]